jgi:hypothetical protein
MNSSFEGRIAVSAYRRGSCDDFTADAAGARASRQPSRIRHLGDLAYEAELRASTDRGLADSEGGRLIPVEDLMKELGIEE